MFARAHSMSAPTKYLSYYENERREQAPALRYLIDFSAKVAETRAHPIFSFNYLPDFTASKSASISAEGFFVRRETTTMQIAEKMNAGRSS